MRRHFGRSEGSSSYSSVKFSKILQCVSLGYKLNKQAQLAQAPLLLSPFRAHSTLLLQPDLSLLTPSTGLQPLEGQGTGKSNPDISLSATTVAVAGENSGENIT